MKEKILRALKLCTIAQANDREQKVARAWESICNTQKTELMAEKEKAKAELEGELEKIKRDYSDFQKLNAAEKKRLQDRIDTLNEQIKSQVSELGLKNTEIANLNAIIEDLKSDRWLVRKYPKDRAKSNEKMTVQSSHWKTACIRNAKR